MQKHMRLHSIRTKGNRCFNVTIDSNHKLPIWPDLLDREFSVAEPDRVAARNNTFIANDESWLYVEVVMVLFSREVVGWSLQGNIT